MSLTTEQHEKLSQMTKAELIVLAKRVGVPGPTSFKKAELVSQLQDNPATAREMNLDPKRHRLSRSGAYASIAGLILTVLGVILTAYGSILPNGERTKPNVDLAEMVEPNTERVGAGSETVRPSPGTVGTSQEDARTVLVHRVQSSSDDRQFIVVQPSQIRAMFRSHTTADATALFEEKYAGRWVRFSGRVTDVYGDVLNRRETSRLILYDGDTCIRVAMEPFYYERAVSLQRGDQVVIDAKISQADSAGPDFVNGMFVDEVVE